MSTADGLLLACVIAALLVGFLVWWLLDYAESFFDNERDL